MGGGCICESERVREKQNVYNAMVEKKVPKNVNLIQQVCMGVYACMRLYVGGGCICECEECVRSREKGAKARESYTAGVYVYTRVCVLTVGMWDID